MKYFCSVCGKELPEPYCLYTIGQILCGICLPIFLENHTKNGIVVLLPPINYNQENK